MTLALQFKFLSVWNQALNASKIIGHLINSNQINDNEDLKMVRYRKETKKKKDYRSFGPKYAHM